MNRYNKIALHLFYWFIFFGWSTVTGAIFQMGNRLTWESFIGPVEISEYIVFMGIFYINYFYIMPGYFKPGRKLTCWLAWFLLLCCFIGFRYLIEEYLLLKWFNITNYHAGTSLLFYIHDNIYFGSQNIMMSVVLWAIDNLVKTEKEKIVLQEEKNQAELSFLKSQVNPHFLFNTLNNIYSLVYHQSDKALPAILKLSELMRYMTRESAVESISLDKELDYIQSFIELESLRTTEKAVVAYTVSGTTGGIMLPPLLLIPFIENGFKHGVVTDPEHPFRITIQVQNNRLSLSTENRINTFLKDSGSGVGLQNVRRRLDIIFPGRHTLTTQKSGDHYICNLLITL